MITFTMICQGEYGEHKPAIEMKIVAHYDFGVKYECPECKNWVLVKIKTNGK